VELQSHLESFEAAGAVIWTITGDDPKRVQAFWEAESLDLTVLSDPAGKTFDSYGIRNLNHDRTVPHPTVVLVGSDGTALLVISDDNYKVRPPTLSILSETERLLGSD
jgi:peroxiredoxin